MQLPLRCILKSRILKHGVLDCRREVHISEARQRYSELQAQLKGSQDNLRSAAYNLSSLQQQQRMVRHHVRLGAPLTGRG